MERIEDAGAELQLIGPAEVEILAHHFFEEAAAGARPIEDLGQGEFRLEDRELIAIAGGAVGGGEGAGGAATCERRRRFSPHPACWRCAARAWRRRWTGCRCRAVRGARPCSVSWRLSHSWPFKQTFTA